MAFYTYIKNKREIGKKVELHMDKGVNLCLEPEEMVIVQIKYFMSVFTKEKDIGVGLLLKCVLRYCFVLFCLCAV